MKHTEILNIPAVDDPDRIVFTLVMHTGQVLKEDGQTVTVGSYSLIEFFGPITLWQPPSGWITGSNNKREWSASFYGDYGYAATVGLLDVKEGPNLLQDLFQQMGKTSFSRRKRVPGIYLRIQCRDSCFGVLGLTPGIPDCCESPVIVHRSWHPSIGKA